MRTNLINAFLLIPLVLASVAHSQFTYPGCAELTPFDFRVEKIVNNDDEMLREPVKMAFDMDAEGNVFIYFIELRDEPKVNFTDANVKLFNPITGEVSIVGTFLGTNGFSALRNEGLSGIALDPDFKTNGWMYFQYAFESRLQKIVRITLVDGMMDFSTEKILLTYEIEADMFHTGGAMEFDDYGDLWIAIGDNDRRNRDDAKPLGSGPGNTNDLRGKILRITPINFPDSESPPEGPGSTYTVPAGNLFNEANDTEDKTRPEIYAMGLRNPYTLNLHPVKKWVMVGDVGPDQGEISEEHLLITEPGNHGWPFFTGNNIPDINGEGRGGFPEAPVNNEPANTGLTNLPPAVPATHAYRTDCAMTGPLYRYNPANTNPHKMPPHFDYHWFIGDCNRDYIQTFKVNEDGTLNGDSIVLNSGRDEELIPNLFDIDLRKILDFKEGPDGAFYLMNYAGSYTTTPETGIFKIDYIGPECNATQDHVYEEAVSTSPVSKRLTEIQLRGAFLKGVPAGTHVTVTSLKGTIKGEYQALGEHQLRWNRDLKSGIYIITATYKEYRKSFRGIGFE